MSYAEYFQSMGVAVASTQQLLRGGARARDLTEAVRSGALVRVRRGHYAPAGTAAQLLGAVRVGGRLACVSAAALHGIFVFDASTLHVHLEHGSSRMRTPLNRRRPLTSMNRDGLQLHWSPVLDPSDGTEYSVGLRDALAQIIRCQSAPCAIAALDGAMHAGLIDAEALAEIFAHVPQRFAPLRGKVNARSESGQESVLRMIVEEMGLDYEIQVSIDGVGRVDMVIAGMLVVEADSRAHHKEWEQHVRDRTRDRLLAARGYLTLRLLYRDIMYDAEGVKAAIRGLLAAHGGARPVAAGQ